MIDRMPSYSRAPIENYLSTGRFKDHQSVPIRADQAEQMIQEVFTMQQRVLEADNSQSDTNKAPGIIEMNEDILGKVKVEFEKGQGQELPTLGYGAMGDENQGAVVFAKSDDKTIDLLIVSTHGGADDGAIHLNRENPSESFTTFSGGSPFGILLS